MDIGNFLRQLGLSQYEAALRENAIDAEVLARLTAQDLKELGITLVGHRRRLLEAVAALEAQAPHPESVPDPSTTGRGKTTARTTVLEAERRQLTVMFCDLVGSTALSARLDPEDLREVIGRYHACVAETVTRFDGFVAKYMGDGVIAYFGYPHAHEDDTEQAIRAGLALVEAVGTLQVSERLVVRIGMATGIVIVGDLIGAGSAQEQAVIGETPNLAARLQALAEPNAIVIAESTRRQIGALFEVADLGPQSLKGFADPLCAWQVLSENRRLGRFEALRSRATPFVGRKEERRLLLRRWAQAKQGSGHTVLISGEPGVGKSRITEVLCDRIATESHIWLRYFCYRHHQDSALYPFIAQWERASGFAPSDALETKLAKLRSLLAAAKPSAQDLALIAELCSLPATDLTPPLEGSPESRKEKTFEALLGLLERFSRQRPVLMVFEDLHWIDPSSRELLDRIIGELGHWPVLMLATFRPEFQPVWVSQPNVTTLSLGRLDRGSTETLIDMSRGGHNWRGTGTVESSRSLDVMELARAGYLASSRIGAWQWTYRDGTTATIGVIGGRGEVTLNYRFKPAGEDRQSVQQRVPIQRMPCRFGGERPWFVCNVWAGGVHCGRRVAKLYGAGRLFACRHCCRLGYQVQRGGPMDRAHNRLARLHRKLGADYDGPEGIPPQRPKWMRQRTYDRIASQIEAGKDHLDHVFTVGAQRILARIDRSDQRRRIRR